MDELTFGFPPSNLLESLGEFTNDKRVFATDPKQPGRKVMGCFRHRRGRILFEVFGAFLIASLSAARWVSGHSTRSLIVAAAIALYGAYRAVMLLARNPALGYSKKGVQVGRLFELCNYRWDQVREIRETHWKRPSIPYLNWLPKERDYIELIIQGAGVQSGSIKVRPEMIEQPPGGAKQIVTEIRAAQVAALGERGAAMARLGAKQDERTVAPASTLQAERWQRLGIGPAATGDLSVEADPACAPAIQVTAPPRPVFGRKIA